MRTSRRLFLPVWFAALAMAGGCGADVPEPESDPTRQYVTTLGLDTIQVEEITFDLDGAFSGVSVRRSPTTVLERFEGRIRDDLRLDWFESTMIVPGTPEREGPARTIGVTQDADSILVVTELAGSTSRQAFPSGARVFPMIAPGSILNFALAKRAAVPRTREDVVLAAEGRVVPVVSDRREDLTATLVFSTGPVSLALTDGRIESADATETTQKFRYERPATRLDLEALADRFASLDREGRGIGALSTRESISAAVGGVSVSVEYGRPSRRGRVVFGALVPWGRVWRTGADAATLFTTTGDLRIGEVTVPAGSYSLWTIPEPDRWLLIFNSQTGQWGTEYDSRQDFVRVPVGIEVLESPVERFSMGFEPAEGGGITLILEWEDLRAEAVFTPAR